MSTDTAAWLARIRAEAEAPGCLFVVAQGSKGRIAITPDDIATKTDDELLAFIARRLDE